MKKSKHKMEHTTLRRPHSAIFSKGDEPPLKRGLRLGRAARSGPAKEAEVQAFRKHPGAAHKISDEAQQKVEAQNKTH